MNEKAATEEELLQSFAEEAKRRCDVISAGRFSSKKPGERRNRLRCTASLMSATVRSPSQDTK